MAIPLKRSGYSGVDWSQALNVSNATYWPEELVAWGKALAAAKDKSLEDMNGNWLGYFYVDVPELPENHRGGDPYFYHVMCDTAYKTWGKYAKGYFGKK